jgi:hypothetical protein
MPSTIFWGELTPLNYRLSRVLKAFTHRRMGSVTVDVSYSGLVYTYPTVLNMVRMNVLCSSRGSVETLSMNLVGPSPLRYPSTFEV